MSGEAAIVIDDDEIIEIPDDDDVELLGECPQLKASRLARHLPLSSFHTLFKGASTSQYWIEVQRDPHSGLKVGYVVPLHGFGGYLQIRELLVNYDNNAWIVIRGIRFERVKHEFPSIRSADNEVILIQEIFPGSEPDSKDLYLENFTIRDIVLQDSNVIERWKLRMTNQRDVISRSLSHPRIIVCSSKYVVTHSSPTTTKASKVVEEAWINLRDEEADLKWSKSDRSIRQQLRLNRGKGIRAHTEGQPYTACDGFCGAGFASAGAKAAGLDVRCAFDRDEHAMSSYSVNHPDVQRRLRMDFFNVLRSRGVRITIIGTDVVMLSFPCQFFSPAHTVAGKNDEANEAILFGLHQFLREIQPRIVVIEQTFGLNHARFRQHLMQVVAAFRDNGYSMRKAVINFAGLGEASERRRLIIIGAAAGEVLPHFPKQEYDLNFQSHDQHLKRAVSIAKRLRLTVATHPEHSSYISDRPTIPKAAYDPRFTKHGTQTCTRSQFSPNSVHWSGSRFYSPHELALLQGAPPAFRIRGKCLGDLLRQVGNAFPSIAAEKIYRKVVKSLERIDRRDRELDLIDPKVLQGSSTETPITF